MFIFTNKYTKTNIMVKGEQCPSSQIDKSSVLVHDRKIKAFSKFRLNGTCLTFSK